MVQKLTNKEFIKLYKLASSLYKNQLYEESVKILTYLIENISTENILYKSINLYRLADSYYKLQDYNEANKVFLNIEKEIKQNTIFYSSKYTFLIYVKIANILYLNEHYNMAINYFQLALYTVEKLNNQEKDKLLVCLIEVYFYLAYSYHQNYNLNDAILYSLKALNLTENNKDKLSDQVYNEAYTKIIIGLGENYYLSKYYQHAIECFNKVIVIKDKATKDDVIFTYKVLGELYLILENYQLSIHNYLELLKFEKDLESIDIIISYIHLINAYYSTKEYKTALNFFYKLINIASDFKEIWGIYFIAIEIFIEQDHLEIAKSYCFYAINQFKNYNNDYIEQINQIKEKIKYIDKTMKEQEIGKNNIDCYYCFTQQTPEAVKLDPLEYTYKSMAKNKNSLTAFNSMSSNKNPVLEYLQQRFLNALKNNDKELQENTLKKADLLDYGEFLRFIKYNNYYDYYYNKNLYKTNVEQIDNWSLAGVLSEIWNQYSGIFIINS